VFLQVEFLSLFSSLIIVFQFLGEFGDGVAFAGGEEEVGFEAVLSGIEVEVSAVELVELVVGAAFDDATVFDDEDLVGLADGGEAVGDDEGGASLHEEVEAGLDEGFGFGVEGAGGFVEDEDARVGEDGARDRDALALAAGELDAAFADDGVVAFGEALGKLVDAGDFAGGHELLFSGGGTGELDVLADGAVEEECLLEDDAELLAVAGELDGGEVVVVDEDGTGLRGVEAADERDDGGFAGAGGADERGNGAGFGLEADAVEDGLVFDIGEGDIDEADVTFERAKGDGAGGVGVFFALGEDFAGTIEAGHGFGELGANGDELHDGRDHEREEHDVADVAADGELAGVVLMAAEKHDQRADDTEHDGGGERHKRLRGERTDDVLQKALNAGGEDAGFAVLGVVALDDADAAEGFGKAAGDFGVDLGALAEDGADDLEGFLEKEGEEEQDDEGEQRHADADVQQPHEGEDRGEHAADKVDDTGADEVAHAFDVGHDAGDEGAGTVFVIEGDGEAADVLLYLLAEVGDEALAGFGEQLREGVGGDALEQGGGERRTDDLGQKTDLVLVHYLVDQRAKERGQNEAGGTVDDHEEEGRGEDPESRFDELPDFRPDVAQLRCGLFLGEVSGDGATGATYGSVCGAHAGSAAANAAAYA
jgi:hypothetical protein